MIYVSLCFILAISCLSNARVITKVNAIIIFLFLSGAYSYGYDWIRYREYYEYVLSPYDISTWRFEPGFSLILSLCRSLGLDYHWVVVICSMIVCVNIYNFSVSRKFRNFSLFFIFAVFGFMEFAEQIRQGVAISFILLATNSLLNNQARRFILFTAIASCFHISALLCFSFPFLYKLMRKNNSTMVALSLVLLGLFTVWGFKFFIDNIGAFGVSGFIADKLKGYSESEGSDAGILSSGLLLNVAVIFISALSTQTRKPETYLAVFFSFFVIESKAVSIAYRFSYYGYAFIYEAFEWLYGLNKGKLINRTVLVFILLVFALKPLLNPVYRDMFDDYHFYWFSLFSELPDTDYKRAERCADLIKNGIQYCGRI
ncbi:EpsG family protein [Enterobacteriaceae bacterium YMB-R22]|uniref:EpsG family protein n=1 Tax=Tenebrionicola larvae TaxID=2815733 RepID=UPI002011F288|nr:EpsG family protein [Tenebrionicola larvae]MBV4412036.1 EpsG family protein [Tenebrionicola larvae]